jgi:transcription-repair coupling factor (superfamily II helicase)
MRAVTDLLIDKEAVPIPSGGRLSPFTPPLPKTGGLRWSGLQSGAKALAIAQAVRRHPAPVLAIVPDRLAASCLEDELRFFLGEDGAYPLLSLPDWEILPYDRFSPYQDIISDRLISLIRIPLLTQGILIVALSTLMHRLAPRDYIEANSLCMQIGERLDHDRFRERLVSCGYRCVSQVMEHGDFALRGSLIDIFPMGSPHPYRIDLFDETIDSMRLFDPESQRSIERVDAIRLLPAREFPLTESAINRFRSNWRTRFAVNPGRCPLYKDVSQGLAPPGIEYYLPLFFEHTATLFDYLPANALVIVAEGVDEEAADAFWAEVCARYEQGRHDLEWPLLKPAEMFLQTHELFGSVGGYPTIAIRQSAATDPKADAVFATVIPPPIPIDARAADPLRAVKHFIQTFEGRVLFAAESKGRRETLLELFHQQGIDPTLYGGWQSFLEGEASVGLTVAPLQQGVQLDLPRLALISEPQLFGEHAFQRRRRQRGGREVEGIIRNLTEIQTGAPVVHESHGVGRYLGLFTLEEVGGILGEFIGLEYAEGARLYVPVAALHLISRYSGIDPEHAPLHKLGSGQWQRVRAKVAQQIHDVAAELLDIYARRASRQGYAFTFNSEEYQAFAQGFPFEETPDQEAAIGAVLSDMQAVLPMDRLVCGDVGFGKTEVAMRAAFVAVMSGKQVAILVPTTLLAQQHFQNFKDRFADWPVRIEQLSRFLGKKEQQAIIEELERGAVDIVIGTHRLLAPELRFKRLGLVIIDEEHRFGVRQKERMKSLRAEVDILTLTATPIPRTLNLALFGTRDLSIIATPPVRRHAIKTFIREWNDRLIEEALIREIGRGGQVYFLHNAIETIDKIAEQIQTLVPEARVHVAHGQMRERELERIMLDFYHRRFNVLVCTTIIESGIDVPTANTIVINRADKFGLAQLYQLRGRVGRSHHRAYAYLLVPSRKAMGADAIKRLEAIEALEELGVGFTLATHDLEIRGAGEILGEEQSGHIQELGFGLYVELLERTIAALREGKTPDLERPLEPHSTEIDLHIPALFPEDYLPDVHTRLILYKRIAGARDGEALNEIKEEVIDRFGLLPEPAKNLFKLTALKIRATPLGIRKIDLGRKGGQVHFHAQPNIDPAAIIRLVQSRPQNFRFEHDNRLRILGDLADAEETRIQRLDHLLDTLSLQSLSS